MRLHSLQFCNRLHSNPGYHFIAGSLIEILGYVLCHVSISLLRVSLSLCFFFVKFF
jgi:hypothetical protein